MDQEIQRIVQAVLVASNPIQQDKSIQSQAVNYLSQILQNSQLDDVWNLALKLFVDTDDGASHRKYDPQTRLFALRILDDFLDNRCVLIRLFNLSKVLIHNLGSHHLTTSLSRRSDQPLSLTSNQNISMVNQNQMPLVRPLCVPM